MSKRSRFWRPFDKQHSKRDQTLLISEWNHLYHICWSLSRQLNWKNSLLVTSKFLRLFVNILTSDDKYSLLNSDAVISETKNNFGTCFCISEIYLKSWTFSKKKINVIADEFPILRAPKTVLKPNLYKVPFQRTLWQSTFEGWPNTVEIWTAAPLAYLLITVKAIDLGKICLSDMQILKTIF